MAAALSSELAERLKPAELAGTLAGLEHEFRVEGPSGYGPVDFRLLVDRFVPGRQGLNPADPNARWLRTGNAITCDGPEAEIALAPVRVEPGFTQSVQAAASSEAADLDSRLRPALHLRGFSTHLSVQQDARTERVARQYALAFAPALMLLLDRADSPGLLVRPRPGRLELCGEFVTGSQLAAALTFAVGSVRACAATVAAGGTGRLPQPVRSRVVPAVARYGWYVDRRAVGADLYRHGRSTQLRLRSGKTITAQQHLEESWGCARPEVAPNVSADELALVDDVVAERTPLPMESFQAASTPAAHGAEARQLRVYGRLLDAIERPAFAMAPVMITWEAVVLIARGHVGGRIGYVCLPGRSLPGFVEALEPGDLDKMISTYLRQPPSGRVLSRNHQVAAAGLYDELGPRLGLLAGERAPARGRLDRLRALLRQAA